MSSETGKGSNKRPYDGERFRNNFDGIKGWESPRGSIIESAMKKIRDQVSFSAVKDAIEHLRELDKVEVVELTEVDGTWRKEDD